jgi:hypothetical protein
VLPAFGCLNNGEFDPYSSSVTKLILFLTMVAAHCNDYNGQCICPPGFGGEDCAKPR